MLRPDITDDDTAVDRPLSEIKAELFKALGHAGRVRILEVLSEQGQHLGTIPVRCPPADCQNLAFAGKQKATLYIGGAGSLYKVETIARGFVGRAK